VQQLRTHLAQGDMTALNRLVHQLHGSGRTYGFAPISDLAEVIEKMLTDGRSPGEIQTAVDGLIAYIERIEGYEPAYDIPPDV
jgi:HPt (histidine-containing phosphotransfer) domain-containing protein